LWVHMDHELVYQDLQRVHADPCPVHLDPLMVQSDIRLVAQSPLPELGERGTMHNFIHLVVIGQQLYYQRCGRLIQDQSSPRPGAKTNVTRKKAVQTSTIAAPDAMLI